MSLFADSNRCVMLVGSRFTVVLVCLLATLVGCGQRSGSLESTVSPGSLIASFPNSNDKNWTTVLSSNPHATQAGVNGRVLTVTTYDGRQPFADQLTLDFDGNLGLRGTLFSRSSRAEKRDIRPFSGDASALLGRIRMVTYHYRNEPDSSPLHVGFIAEDAPSEFVGPSRKSLNINNTIALNMAASQQMKQQIDRLTGEVAGLEKELAALRRRQ